MQAIGLVLGMHFDRVHVIGLIIGQKWGKGWICEGSIRHGMNLVVWDFGIV